MKQLLDVMAANPLPPLPPLLPSLYPSPPAAPIPLRLYPSPPSAPPLPQSLTLHHLTNHSRCVWGLYPEPYTLSPALSPKP